MSINHKSAVLANQVVTESKTTAYPFREGSTPKIEVSKPCLIEDEEDAIEFTLTAAVLGAIIVSFFLVVELMYPGWSVMGMEVIHG